jgi:hypothetical protein
MSRLNPNLAIRSIFVAEFKKRRRHIKIKSLRKWFETSRHLEGFTNEEKNKAFYYLQTMSDIVIQDDNWAWIPHGISVRPEGSLDCDSVGNTPIASSGTGQGRLLHILAHPRWR